MSKRRRALGVAAKLVLGAAGMVGVSGCSDPEPDYTDCLEWREPGFVALSGELHLRYSSTVRGTSPNDNFKPYGWHDDAVAHVYGCALDPDGNLWRLRTYWGFPPADPPYPVVLDRDSESDAVATFAGDGELCKNADCASGDGKQGVFYSRLEPNLVDGEGQVTEWSLSPATLKAEVVVHPYFPMTDSDATITVDVVWPAE